MDRCISVIIWLLINGTLTENVFSLKFFIKVQLTLKRRRRGRREKTEISVKKQQRRKKKNRI